MQTDYEWYANADLSKYSGKWVAIIDKKVIASNANAKNIIEEVKKKYPKKKPLIAKVSNGTLIL